MYHDYLDVLLLARSGLLAEFTAFPLLAVPAGLSKDLRCTGTCPISGAVLHTGIKEKPETFASRYESN